VNAFLLALTVTLATAVPSAAQISGTILDSSGAPVPDARVRLEVSGAAVAEVRTGGDGRFQFAIEPSRSVQVVVTASGFAQATTAVTADSDPVQITLRPAAFFEEVNVTSSRADLPRTDPTSTVTVISSTDLTTSGPLTVDDALKMVPGFTLFRRTSSRTANPTTQGVALRGIGGTAQSRSLVLADGLPLNDAFGGWVYWSKVPQAAIDRIEVQRGSGSDLYGADAVGGVVQLLTLRPTRPAGRALLEAGTLGTGRVSLFAGSRARGWRYSAGGEWFTIDGYIPVATEQDPGIAPRGPIDGKLGSTHRAALASAGYQTASGWRADVAGNVFDEHRENATPLSINSTASRQLSGELAGGVGGGLLSVRGFGGTQQYRQVFTTVNASRTAETLNRDQNVPSSVYGLGGQWFRAWGRHGLLVGAEGRHVEGTSVETPYVQGRPLATTEAGGTQRLGSAFVQDTVRVSDRATLVLGAHADGWRSTSLITGFEKSSGSFNPRASGSYRVGESGVTVRGAVYHGFRAPTLNEFYRNFGSGNTQTRPNEALNPERLTGGDVGLLIGRGRVSARVTGFYNVLDEAITTITISSTPQLIVRQRANADRLRASGVEIEGDFRVRRSLSVAVTSGFVDSHFTGATGLGGKRVPQVPEYNAGLSVRYVRPVWTASAQLRVTGPQFEDDQNVYTLRRATVLDAFAGRTLTGRITAFVAVENVFDAIYDVGRTPTLTTGLPRAARVGIQMALP
jgi:outer membrane receptor protein involved in Fe transport